MPNPRRTHHRHHDDGPTLVLVERTVTKAGTKCVTVERYAPYGGATDEQLQQIIDMLDDTIGDITNTPKG